ncbi:MAG: hypothetical protein KY439_09395 [Actinobacteria bacterium]|nr:hypothetical protein [Actinomycetota bacterium]
MNGARERSSWTRAGSADPNGAHLAVFTAEERPELWEHAEASFPVVWPEYNLHGDVSSQYFSVLYPRHAHVQVLV